jgi:hypothetical protein
MKAILSLGKHSHIARVGIFLIAVALIVGTLSCAPGGGAVKYSLTMAANPVAGGTAADLTGGSPYPAGTVVNIKATANPGYKFVNWSAPAGTFGSATSATTTFTMPARNVTVTANFVKVYSLTMAVNPAGGGTANDLTGGSPYPAGTVVSIKAAATPPYQFAKWTSSDGGTFGNSNAAQTTFTMPAQDVTVTANFVRPLDHFTCYSVDSEWYVGENVILEDQFGVFNVTVGSAYYFGNPAEKEHGNVTPIWDADDHFTVYDIIYKEEEIVVRSVEVKNQFGTQNLTVYGPWGLAVPTQKEGHQPPVALDHYLLYYVMEGTSVEQYVNLGDEFGNQTEVYVTTPVFFANPVQKTHDGNVTKIVNPDVHAVIYSISGGYFEKTVQVANQFGEQALNVSGPDYLAVPSEKIVPPAPPLDHFKCYGVANPPTLKDVYVGLMDQFGIYDGVQVNYADWFCNPVTKVHGQETPIVNPDNHLTVYSISLSGEPQYWQVEVQNQFGPQTLTVYGPVALAAPTQKLEPGGHGPPSYLDHYLLYQVVEGSDLNATVDLDDEFPGAAPGVNVTTPVYFANPVLFKYNYSSGDMTGAWNPEAHLVFYAISDNPEFQSPVLINNQFELQSLDLVPIEELLAVPSEKNFGFTTFEQPGDRNYLGDTTLIDISGLTDYDTYGSIGDGTLTVSFDTDMEKLTVPTSWATWACPPWTESCTPHVLYSQGLTSQTLTLSAPCTIFGFELEPCSFGLYGVEVEFILSYGPAVLGTISMTVDGNAGARLFAAQVYGQTFDKIEIVVDAGSNGFSIAQVRYALG